MQASAQSQRAPVAAGSPPADAAPGTLTIVGADGKTQTLTIPGTEAEVASLKAQRNELSDQLTSVSARRSELAEELSNTTDGAARTGLEDRLRVLDKRIIQLETDLASTGRQISAAPSELVASVGDESSPAGDDNFEGGLMAGGFSALLLAAIALLFARRRWKRAGTGFPSRLEGESARRLERLEHGMEAIAIEIERVSEGQRFVTKLLSEQSPLGTRREIAQESALVREDLPKR
jgi:hypothetical protein